MSISVIAYLYPYWTILACAIHIIIMTTWLQLFDRSPFCAHNKMAELSFSLALGGVYLFTYILPIEGRTRYRYAVYYTICFVQNIACGVIWFLFVPDDIRRSVVYLPVLIFTVVPYIVGICLMVVYYSFFHPKRGKSSSDISVSFKVSGQISEVS